MGLIVFCQVNVYAQTYNNAILIDAHIREHTGKGSVTFDVVQIFLKSNYTLSTCSVSRNKRFEKKEEAQQFINNMVLGTTRPLYRSYGKDTCFDNASKTPDTIVGYILLSCFVLFCLVLYLLCFILFYKNI